MPETSLREALNTLAKEDPVLWAAYYRRIRGKPLVFDNAVNLTTEALRLAKRAAKNRQAYAQDVMARLLRHRPFLCEPLRDEHQHKVYMKARQMGVSEISYIEEAWFLENHPHTKAVHSFPREKNLKRFVASRIDPSFEETPRMKALLTKGQPNGIFLKRIKDSFLILDSAWESQLGEGVDADMVTLDERDRMNPGVEMAFMESLRSSPYNRLRELSTPTLPGRGVGLTFYLSDQREYLHRCTKCNLEQEMVYPDNVVQMKDFKSGTKVLEPGTYEYLCRREACRGPIDRMRGRWVAKKPSVPNIRGYHMSHMNCPWITATLLMQSKIKLRFPDIWMKYDLGLPALGEGTLLLERDYENACSGHELLEGRTEDWTDVVGAIDWGATNWITVEARNVHNGRRYVIGVGIFDDDPREPLEGSAKAAKTFLDPFRPDIVVADDGYGKDRNAYLLKFYQDTGTEFFACRYNPAPKVSRQFATVWNENSNQVMVDRGMWLKMMCRAIKRGEVGLPSYDLHEGNLIKEHLKALRPMMEYEDEDEAKDLIETIISNGPDHLAHTLVYCEVGYEWLEKNSRAGLLVS